MTAPIRCVVLDIDDTLYLERDYVRSGFEAVGQALGEQEFGPTAWRVFLEGGRGDTFNQTFSRLGYSFRPDAFKNLKSFL